MAKKIVLTQSQKNELRELAEAIAASEKAKAIRARFKAFTDDNLEALKEGVEVDGLALKVKVTKMLTAEEVSK